ncbi:hypothetical protein FJV41_17570 [Myxococcus llanfairpwllgwyngyllgogerychwyrndrobwllllantysiliogogogochensis]|uniref:Lipoprotein n=1 Tax=Myxococcus llanfairpwllgwyngyllgogerychwyrndrobwllllantysiliogogogochensis TaxID=2590453 RepID=A0A540X0B7_9BACT|nr:hypothetical protein [Myxococcus llanfairpwllgwyngyllgogerychwyrndrobwllllantysiliogogogochensis]TQF14666.1 hypothetical protein FJV41_17570 [Myxococcus llanfairpwllgwyngyllgogerychwyrndrobwllllantysiliogogogochensis]
MSLRRALLTVVLTSTSLLTACALRPTYKELIAPPSAAGVAPGQIVALRVVDGSGKPVEGARVRAGEGRTRLNVLSDADGLVKLEANEALLKENPLVEVVLPKGVKEYRLQLAPSGEAPAAPVETAPQAPAAPEQAPATETPATETPATETPASGTPATTPEAAPSPVQQPSGTPAPTPGT